MTIVRNSEVFQLNFLWLYRLIHVQSCVCVCMCVKNNYEMCIFMLEVLFVAPSICSCFAVPQSLICVTQPNHCLKKWTLFII